MYMYSVKVLRKFLNVRLVNTLTSETNCQLVIAVNFTMFLVLYLIPTKNVGVFFFSRITVKSV
jgi:hypothetical protein